MDDFIIYLRLNVFWVFMKKIIEEVVYVRKGRLSWKEGDIYFFMVKNKE